MISRTTRGEWNASLGDGDEFGVCPRNRTLQANIIVGNTVEIKQIYAYKCPGKNNRNPVKMKSYTITRRVKMDGGLWKTNVSKDGYTSPYWVIP